MAQLDALRAQLRSQVTSRHQGERKSTTRGATGEFFGHRPYSAGDDLRRVDWKAYARTGQPVLKQFRAEEELTLRVVVDSSASQRGYFDKVQKLAAALAYVALGQGERVQMFAGADALRLSDLPRRTLRNYPALARGLELQVASGATNLYDLLRAVGMRAARAGALIILSDFLDTQPFAAQLRELRRTGHELALLHCLPAEDEFAAMWGDYSLEDSETGETVEVSVDDALLRDFDAAQLGHRQHLEALARAVHGKVWHVSAAAPVVQICAEFFGVALRPLSLL